LDGRVGDKPARPSRSKDAARLQQHPEIRRDRCAGALELVSHPCFCTIATSRCGERFVVCK
jgi:hypothetical protein